MSLKGGALEKYGCAQWAQALHCTLLHCAFTHHTVLHSTAQLIAQAVYCNVPLTLCLCWVPWMNVWLKKPVLQASQWLVPSLIYIYIILQTNNALHYSTGTVSTDPGLFYASGCFNLFQKMKNKLLICFSSIGLEQIYNLVVSQRYLGSVHRKNP